MGVYSYADDLSLLSPSFTGLQEMLRLCELYAIDHTIIFNAKKSQVQLGPRYEGQLNPMAEPIPHEVRPLVRTHDYHPYHAADRHAETDS